MSTDSSPLATPPVTISEIAAELGLSVPTISKVLNGRSDVSPRTRDKVERALERHQYRRRSRNSASDIAPLVDLVFHDLGSPWSMEIVRGVERAVALSGLSVVLSSLGGQHSPQQGWIDAVLARRPRG